MKIQLRDYQLEAVTQTSMALSGGYKRPLIIAPTASGKSFMIAEIVVRMMRRDALSRVLIICHQQELLIQNEEKILLLDENIFTGVYCAGAGRKERDSQVVLASRDSLGNDPMCCGDFDVIIVDEAHLIAKDAWTNPKTNYGKIFNKIKPQYVIGLTGTPWRSGKGVVYKTSDTDDSECFFDVCSYDIKMQDLIDADYLCKYIFPQENVKVINADGLSVAATGDFKTADLEKLCMPDEVIAKCLNLWEKHASDRKVTIFFACSREHGQAIADMLREYVEDDQIAYVDGKTAKPERDQMMIDIKKGAYKCIVNIGVLTTGFDAPIIDCVVWMRATASVSLFVQMGGRGLRLFEGKENCLMLDMAGNFDRFNSLADPIADYGNGSDKKKEPKPKECSRSYCGRINPPHLKFCTDCGYILPKLGPLKRCGHCDHVNPAAASTCSNCKRLFINHQETAHTDEAIKVFKVWGCTVMPNEKTKKGDACVKVLISAGPNSLDTKTYWLTLMPNHERIFVSKKGKALLWRLKWSNPSEIQVHKNTKGYDEVKIITWVHKTPSELEGCQHQWEKSISPHGLTRTICPDCGEIK